MTLNKRGQLVPIPASQLKMGGVKVPLKDIRTGITNARKDAKDKCSPGKPMPKALDVMSKKCRVAFVKELYAGPITGRTVFRGRARKLSAGYLAMVKSVLSSVPAKKAAPVAPVAPPPAAVKPENDAALKDVVKRAAQLGIMDHCRKSSNKVTAKLKCDDTPYDEPGKLYGLLKKVGLNDMPAGLKQKIIGRFKELLGKDAALKAKYPIASVNEALVAKMWKPSGFGTVSSSMLTSILATPGKSEKLKKPKKKGGSTSKFWHINLHVGPTIGGGKTGSTKCTASDYIDVFPGMDDPCGSLNVMDLMGFTAGVSVLFGRGKIRGGFGVDYRFNTAKPPESQTSSGEVGKTHNIAVKGRVEYDLMPWLMIGVGLGFGAAVFQGQNFADLGVPKSMSALTFDADVVVAARLKQWKSVALLLQLKPYISTALRPGFTRQDSAIPGSDVTGHPKSIAYGAALELVLRF